VTRGAGKEKEKMVSKPGRKRRGFTKGDAKQQEGKLPERRSGEFGSQGRGGTKTRKGMGKEGKRGGGKGHDTKWNDKQRS